MNKPKRLFPGNTLKAWKTKIAHMRKTLTASAAELGLLGLAFSSVVYSALPATAFTGINTAMAEGSSQDTDAIALQIAAMKNKELSYGTLPTSDLRGPLYTTKITATAYNSEVGQCDATPFITASGTHTRWGVIASNYFPIGTKIRIPDVYGDQIFVVEDRMNARYTKRMDIWMESHSDAVKFGVRNVTIEVYGK